METRKIQIVGKKTYSISLPKKWIDENKLKPQDPLFITTNSNNELILIPGKIDNKKEFTDIDFKYDINSIANLEQFLVYSYVKNINKIELTSKNIEYEKIVEIKKALKYLDGYEITNQDEKTIEISFIFKDINVNISKILIRMSYILCLMFESLKNKDFAMTENMENDIDNLYHLGKRILVKCLTDKEMTQTNNINNIEDTFFLNDIIKKLEQIADYLYIFCNKKLSTNDFNIIESILKIINSIIKRTSTVFEKSEEFKKIEISNDTSGNTYYLHKIRSFANDIIENIFSIEYNKKFYK